MFKGREENAIAEVAAQIEPYRRVVVAYETDQRLQSQDVELIALGHHLLTSNDRYQYSGAYLVLTHNHAMLFDAVADSMTKSKDDDFKASGFSYEVVTDFLLKGYQTVSDGLENADRIAAIKGFKATDSETGELQTLLQSYDWPRPDQVSRRFLGGTIDGLRQVNINTNNRYLAMIKSAAVPNSMRIRLQQHVDPLMATLKSKLDSIDRITNHNVAAINSEKVMADLYKDVMEALAAADQAAVWMTLPKIFDASFTLNRPLDELNAPKKSFDAASLGVTVVQKAAAPQASPGPQVPQKSFDPSSLLSPPAPATPPAPQQPTPHKPFDPNSLGVPKRPFDPNTLGKPAVNEVTEEKPDDVADCPKTGRSFSIDDLK